MIFTKSNLAIGALLVALLVSAVGHFSNWTFFLDKAIERIHTELPQTPVNTTPTIPSKIAEPVDKSVKEKDKPKPQKVVKEQTLENKPPKIVNRSTTDVDRNAIYSFYVNYNDARLPAGRVIYVCSGHSCTHKSRVLITDRMIDALEVWFSKVSDPAEERYAIGKAIEFLETVIGKQIGTSTDIAGTHIFGSGDKSQMDSVDEAINSTNYVTVLHNIGLIKYHSILKPHWKGFVANWALAVIKDPNNVRWSIDSGNGPNGSVPLINKLY